jgi:hypothetical protein
MAVDARCGNCGENLGKCTENGTTLHCGTCGWTGPNKQLKDYYPRIWRETKAEEAEYDKTNKR